MTPFGKTSVVYEYDGSARVFAEPPARSADKRPVELVRWTCLWAEHEPYTNHNLERYYMDRFAAAEHMEELLRIAVESMAMDALAPKWVEEAKALLDKLRHTEKA